MNIFVSNLSASAHKNHLQNLFSEFGLVRSTTIIKGYFTNKACTSCLVIIDDRTAAVNAIRNLDLTSFMNKIIRVRKALLYL